VAYRGKSEMWFRSVYVGKIQTVLAVTASTLIHLKSIPHISKED